MDADFENKTNFAAEWTYRWEDFRKVSQRIDHENKRLKEELIDSMQQGRLMRKELSDAMKQRQEDAAMIGSLLARCDKLAADQATLQDRLDKASEVVTSIRRDLKPVGAK